MGVEIKGVRSKVPAIDLTTAMVVSTRATGCNRVADTYLQGLVVGEGASEMVIVPKNEKFADLARTATFRDIITDDPLVYDPIPCFEKCADRSAWYREHGDLEMAGIVCLYESVGTTGDLRA